MKGSDFELDHATCPVKPLQKPTPPIWIGANADVAIRRAARIGDCWYINPHNTLATIERQMDLYKRALDEYGKPFPAEVPMRREVFVAPTRAEAIRRAQPYLEEKYKAYRAWGQDKVMPEGDDFDHEFDELLEDRFLLGSPAEVADQTQSAQPAARCQPSRRLDPLAGHAEQPRAGTIAVAGRGSAPAAAPLNGRPLVSRQMAAIIAG